MTTTFEPAIGIPPADWTLISRLVDDAANAKSFDALCAYVDVLIAMRCRQPTDDLISRLIVTDVGGDALTADELRGLVVGMLTSASPRADAESRGSPGN